MSRWGGYGKVPGAAAGYASTTPLSSPMNMLVTGTPSNDLVSTNYAFCSPADTPRFHLKGWDCGLALVGNRVVLSVKAHDTIPDGSIALNAIQRQYLKVSKQDPISVEKFTPPEKGFKILALTVELDFLKARVRKEEQIDAVVFGKEINRRLINQVFSVGQKATIEYCGTNYILTVQELVVEGQQETENPSRGMIFSETTFIFETSNASGIKITNQRGGASTS